VATSELEFARDYDLPPSIVWDALVDEDLVEGWLAAARIEPRLGGLYWLNWQSGSTLSSTNGTIIRFEPPDAGREGRLGIETDNVGTLEFSLAGTPGGTRGSGTLLRLRILVDTDPRLQASTHAYWQSNFDQLEDLLRGHPVDWSTWQRDRGEAWARYLRGASGTN
jgi:uncharacterized protein YndB with AHSA1/START domain